MRQALTIPKKPLALAARGRWVVQLQLNKSATGLECSRGRWLLFTREVYRLVGTLREGKYPKTPLIAVSAHRFRMQDFTNSILMCVLSLGYEH